ncbi:hypothetical protein ABHF91_05630 [Pseudaeromonas sp. ZJS20]|uniref:Uncharacterized protein n=1 Tax=Pseudaeromonas paramecii TaxID=2138166 RepID=A0ABP8Q6U8_9GAMM
MIQIDPIALAQLKTLQLQLSQPCAGLRLIAEGDPCLGVKVRMGWSAVQQPEDVMVQLDGLTVLADRHHWPLLKGCQIELGERLGEPGLAIQVMPGGCQCSSARCEPVRQAS